MTLRVGVIGCGRMGLKHIQAYQEAGCQVVSICDTETLSPHHPHGIADLRGYPVSEGDDYRVTCSDPCINIISIATPDQTHAEIAISALRAGKHVFVEKPAATSSTELEALREAYTASQGHLSSNLCLRTNPEMQWLRWATRVGVYGSAPRFIGDYRHNLGARLTTGWRSGPNYSHIHGGGIHMADLAVWLGIASPAIDAVLDWDGEQSHYIRIKGYIDYCTPTGNMATDLREYTNRSWLAHDATALIHQFVAAVQGGDWPDTLPTAEEVFRGVEICNQIVEGEG